MGTFLSFFTGRAAKAGIALFTGALTTGGGAAAVDAVSDTGMSLLGYIIVGALAARSTGRRSTSPATRALKTACSRSSRLVSTNSMLGRRAFADIPRQPQKDARI
jgi:hypothetical protein